MQVQAPRRSHPEKRHRQPTPAKRRPPQRNHRRNRVIDRVMGMLDDAVGDKRLEWARGVLRSTTIDAGEPLPPVLYMISTVYRREPGKAYLQRAYQ